MKENLYEPNKVRLYSGIYLNPFKMDIENIRIIDIAHALAMKPRFNGNLQAFYSIADHSVWCANKARLKGYSLRLQMAALLHDASEAYLWDIPTPLKSHVTVLHTEVENLQKMIYKKYLNIPVYRNGQEKDNIKQIDREALQWEWDRYMLPHPTETPIRDKNWRESKWNFIKRFYIIGKNMDWHDGSLELMREVNKLGSTGIQYLDERMFFDKDITLHDYLCELYRTNQSFEDVIED